MPRLQNEDVDSVLVRELMFVGVGFEKTRNLKLVTQNFFVPLHPEIGLRPFFLRFATKAAEPSAMRFARSMLVRSGSKRFARSRFKGAAQRKNRNFVNSK